MKAKRYMKPPSCRKPATVTVPYAGPALDGQRPTRTISELRILSVNPGRKSWEGTKGTTSPCPSRVKLRRTQCEHMFSELHPESGHYSIQTASLKGAKARNRCLIARYAGSLTASPVTGCRFAV